MASFKPFFVGLLGVLATQSAQCANGASGTRAMPSPQGTLTPQVVPLLEGRDVIWSLDFLPDGKILFTEKKGTLSVFDPASKKVGAVTGVPVVAVHGQGGLLDVRLHPSFAQNKLVFLAHAKKVDGGYTTALTRAELNVTATGASLSNVRELFAAVPATSAGQHFGSRIAFSADGSHLFVSVGDRGERDRARDLSTHLGKIHRLTLEGKPPTDNPFVGRAGARPEIWSYGHRNVQGLQLDKATGTLWAHEHGPRGGDEINRVEKGADYGWPVVTYGREYYGPKIGEGATKAGVQAPLYHYTPSIGPSGFAIYGADTLPAWKGKFLIGALALEHLNVFNPVTKSESRMLSGEKERVREVRVGPDGLVYLGTDSGKILRLSY
ncbi:MAG: PQQ-dependent sugar dehydrogenase [Silvanigrellales bacterium]|nr:PQQ-dependent sugar dehydrogenase [Silvanigrellales bacterium]